MEMRLISMHKSPGAILTSDRSCKFTFGGGGWAIPSSMQVVLVMTCIHSIVIIIILPIHPGPLRMHGQKM